MQAHRPPQRSFSDAGRRHRTYQFDSDGTFERRLFHVAPERTAPPKFEATSTAITLRQLQYFLAVAEDEHFTRASERLVIAQSALSRQVKELEEVLGVELFVRDRRGVHLTEGGRELLERTRTMFAALEVTVERVRSTGRGERGRLRLGYYGPSFYNNVTMRSALERFRAEAPDVEVISCELFSGQMVSALRDGRIDIAICPDVPRGPDIESRLVVSERLAAILPENDPLASKPVVALADFEGRDVIAFQTDLTIGLYQRVTQLARDAGVPLRIVRELTQLTSIAYHVSRKEGIAILPASTAAVPFPGVVTREIGDPRATIDIVALTRRREDSSAPRRFIDLLTPPMRCIPAISGVVR